MGYSTGITNTSLLIHYCTLFVQLVIGCPICNQICTLTFRTTPKNGDSLKSPLREVGASGPIRMQPNTFQMSSGQTSGIIKPIVTDRRRD